MTCSIEIYRQKIGTYQLGPNVKSNFSRPRTYRTNRFRPRLGLSLLIYSYSVIIIFLPNILGTLPTHRENPSPWCCTSVPPLVSASYSKGPTKLHLVRSTASSQLLYCSPEIWDPGPSKGLARYLSNIKRNKLAHILNGNQGKRGKGINCLYWNKGPSLLANKHHDIETIIADHHPHVLGLGEANFSHAQDLDSVQFPGYSLHLDTGINIQGMARVAVYTHTSLKVKRRQDLEDWDTTAIWLECGLPRQKSILICAGYRQWRLLGQNDNSSASVSEQLSRWLKFLDKWELALNEGKEVIVMLDANLDFLTWRNSEHLPSHHSRNKLKSLIDALFARIFPLGVSQQVTTPTRIERGHPRAGLDHIYTNRPDKLSPVDSYFTGMSDHKLLKVKRFSKSLIPTQRFVRKRSFKKFDSEQFKNMLGQMNLMEIMENTSVDVAVDQLTQKLTNVLDKLAPIRVFQARTQYAPWLSEECKKLKKQREEAFEKAAKSDDPEDWRSFRAIRNQVTGRSRADKKLWEETKLENSDNMWKSVKSWLGWKNSGSPTQLFYEGRMVTRPAAIASSMNKFFIEKVKSLRQNIPVVDKDPLKYMKEAMKNNDCKFSLTPVSEADVVKLIKGLKSSTATGMDYIDKNTVKLVADQLAPVITFIINLSIQTSIFPTPWKWHKVIPLLKSTSADPLTPKSYRPVALLPIISKILEKAVFNQLVQYLEFNELIHPNLHGSRAGHSTATALSQLYDEWVEEVEAGKMVGVLLCDQSAAFDLCDHYILIEKMKLMGVDDISAAWFCSYLSGRRQSCYTDGQLSAPLNIPSCGVP